MKKKYTLYIFLFFFFLNISFNGFAQVDTGDSLALVDLYNSTNGQQWYNSTNWLSAKPLSEWYGIALNNNRVSFVDLSKNNLDGVLSLSLGNLSNITWLNLEDNQLSGNIPPELGNCIFLLTLRLAHNKLIGIIPQELGKLIRLAYDFDLSYNQLTGNIPPELSELGTAAGDHILAGFNISNNLLSGTIPPELGNNFYYTSIYLLNNNFTFDGLEYLLQQKYPYPDDVHYSPQADISLHQTGSSLSVDAGGTLRNNTYKWFMVGSNDSVVILSDSVFYPSQSGKYYAVVNNSICTKLTLYTDTIDFSHVLPVTIMNVKAQKMESIIKIDWSTLAEINIANYEIQRSSNENEFTTIGSLKARNNGSTTNDYTFKDIQPFKGNNYYRIKVFDKDGKIAYSKIVLVNLSDNEKTTLVYPVPGKNILYIQTNEKASFSLISQTGKVLITTYIDGKGSMNVQNISAGIYYLKNNKTGIVQKIFITH